MMFRVGFLPGFVGQLLIAISQITIAVISIFFSNPFYFSAAFYSLVSFAEYLCWVLFYLLFSVSARKIAASKKIALVTILGSSLALFGLTVTLVMKLIISPGGYWQFIHNSYVLPPIIIGTILNGLGQFLIGAFFLKSAKKWSFPSFWRSAGIFYIVGGLFECTLLWGSSMILLAAWLMGAACLGAERA